MRVITVATHEHGYLAALRASCRRFGYELRVLGWQQPWRGFRWRVQLVVDELERQCAPNELVMCVDAFDVVMSGPAREARDAFWRLCAAADTAPMVVSAQREWHGVAGWAQARAFDTASASTATSAHGCGDAHCTSPFRVICAGTYMATAGYAAALLLRCLRDDPHCADDQLMLNRCCNRALAARAAPPFVIDCGRRVFGVLMPNFVSLRPRAVYAGDGATFGADGRVTMRDGDGNATRPCATHFSGSILAANEIRALGYAAPADEGALSAYDWQKTLYHARNIALGNRPASNRATTTTITAVAATVGVLVLVATVATVAAASTSPMLAKPQNAMRTRTQHLRT